MSRTINLSVDLLNVKHIAPPPSSGIEDGSVLMWDRATNMARWVKGEDPSVDPPEGSISSSPFSGLWTLTRTLTWSTERATYVFISGPGINLPNAALSGTVQFTPPHSGTITMTMIGLGGTTTRTTQTNVLDNRIYISRSINFQGNLPQEEIIIPSSFLFPTGYNGAGISINNNTGDQNTQIGITSHSGTNITQLEVGIRRYQGGSLAHYHPLWSYSESPAGSGIWSAAQIIPTSFPVNNTEIFLVLRIMGSGFISDLEGLPSFWMDVIGA